MTRFNSKMPQYTLPTLPGEVYPLFPEKVVWNLNSGHAFGHAFGY